MLIAHLGEGLRVAMSIFGEFKINNNQLVATETGAHIPLNGEFARDALRIASFRRRWRVRG